MADDQPRPEAVEAAAAWLRERGDTFTREALSRGLREAGYTEAEIRAAFARTLDGPADAAATPAGKDLRARAAVILIGVYFATWAVVSLLVEAPGTGTYGLRYWGFAAIILGGILGVLGLLSVIGVYNSGRLRRGVEGALVAVLAIPFILLAVVAGLCVATTVGQSVAA